MMKLKVNFVQFEKKVRFFFIVSLFALLTLACNKKKAASNKENQRSPLVTPNILDLKIPKKDRIVDPNTDKVSIDSLGQFYFNGMHINRIQLENKLKNNAALKRNGKYRINLSPKPNSQTESVVIVMDMALRLDIDCILDVEK